MVVRSMLEVPSDADCPRADTSRPDADSRSSEAGECPGIPRRLNWQGSFYIGVHDLVRHAAFRPTRTPCHAVPVLGAPAHLPPEPTPGAYHRAFQRTLHLLVSKLPANATLELISDGHPGYRSGLREHPARTRIRHRAFPNPKQRFQGERRTPEARRRDREMFAVDLLHSLIRHSQAHHRRETIAFGRRHNALIERGFLMMAWRNFIKRRTERRSDTTTPAMILGLTDRPWSWARVLSQRLFATRIGLSESWMRFYRREILTPQIGSNTRHRLIHAF